MQIRDNIRRRRQERIVQLLGRRADDLPPESRPDPARQALPPHARPDRQPSAAVPPSSPVAPAAPPAAGANPDPELWWKEQQRRLNRTKPTWQGADNLNTASAPASPPVARRTLLSRLAAGLAVRTVIAAVLFGAVWLWFQSDLPGNRAVRDWTTNAVTRDMDFQAAEAWYSRNFGGSPSFLPVFRGSRNEAQAVSGEWKRSEAVPPVAGRIVQTFAQDGSGIRMAAAAGTEVLAASAGRVMSVTTDGEGRATIRIRHAGRIETEYGNVSQPAVRPDDWVLAGQRLGIVPAPKDKVGESLLYFAVRKDDQTVDPAEVVPFD